jgi:hypothetical protein
MTAIRCTLLAEAGLGMLYQIQATSETMMEEDF